MGGLRGTDREFGTSFLVPEQVGWDWLSTQLEDGTDLMLFQLRRAYGTRDDRSSGTCVDSGGRTLGIGARDFQLTPRSRWKSPAGGAECPAFRELRIGRLNLKLEVRAALRDMELRAERPGGVASWEGAVEVAGMCAGRPVKGRGYLEMTGYAGGSMGDLFRRQPGASVVAQATAGKSAGSDPPIRIGISTCLLGEKVRFDGGHKHDRYLTHTLGEYFDWVPVCPEVELGLGTPRETLRLEQGEEGVRLVMPKSGRDWTAPMHGWAAARVEVLAEEDLCGYILKSDSPSCGLFRVRVYGPSGMPNRNGRGLFAERLASRFPHLPIEEEGRLCDPRLRENWVERVFAYRRLKTLWDGRWTVGRLVEFHTAHKLVLLSHSNKAYQSLGRLVAAGRETRRGELRERYHSEFMQALAIPATRGRHANVLQHMAGYFKKQLDEASRHELQGLIEDYRTGLLPLIVPVTLIRHHVRLFGAAYLAGQVYLNPHPKELALRNHV